MDRRPRRWPPLWPIGVGSRVPPPRAAIRLRIARCGTDRPRRSSAWPRRLQATRSCAIRMNTSWCRGLKRTGDERARLGCGGPAIGVCFRSHSCRPPRRGGRQRESMAGVLRRVGARVGWAAPVEQKSPETSRVRGVVGASCGPAAGRQQSPSCPERSSAAASGATSNVQTVDVSGDFCSTGAAHPTRAPTRLRTPAMDSRQRPPRRGGRQVGADLRPLSAGSVAPRPAMARRP